ncbi:Ionotropic receptor 185 [Hyalella azteca]|uniref:Ionotropic receptor 185 n=1 Tax=Hyalella azteca TaxID=294128 RepID=A0A6A0H948_HYAAZ|nr:Ionotropic receptor 185 [Hyalella azteca]
MDESSTSSGTDPIEFPLGLLEKLVGEFDGSHVLLLQSAAQAGDERDLTATLAALWRLSVDTRLDTCGSLLQQNQVLAHSKLLVLVYCNFTDTLDFFTQVKGKHQLASQFITWLVPLRDFADKILLEANLIEELQVLAVRQLPDKVQIFHSQTLVDESISLIEVGFWSKPKSEGIIQLGPTLAVQLPIKGFYSVMSRFANLEHAKYPTRRVCAPTAHSNSSSDRIYQNRMSGDLVLKSPVFPTARDLRKQNLHGRTLLVSIVDNWPFVSLGHDDLHGGGTKSGIDFHITETLGSLMNFTTRIVTPVDGQWGGRLPNGSWTGMIGMVERREVHFAIGEITITGEREAVIDFTRFHYCESMTIVSKARVTASPVFAVLSPFSSLVWLLLLVFFLLAGPTMKIFSVCQKRLGLLTEPKRSSMSAFSFYAFRLALMQHDDSASVQTSSLRLIALFWGFFSFIIAALYSGLLTAALVSPPQPWSINSLQDLLTAVKRDGVLPVVLEGSSGHAVFLLSAAEVYRELYQHFTADSLAKNKDDGYKKVLYSKGAYIDGILSARTRTLAMGDHKFSVSREAFSSESYGIAARSGAPYVVAFNTALGRLVDSGLIGKWEREAVASVTRQSALQAATEELLVSLNLHHLQGAFVFYAMGMALALICFLIERYCSAALKQIPTKNNVM